MNLQSSVDSHSHVGCYAAAYVGSRVPMLRHTAGSLKAFRLH